MPLTEGGFLLYRLYGLELNSAETWYVNHVSTRWSDRLTCVSGCSETLMAVAVLEEAGRTAGKEAVAMEAYARALLQLPTIIADNGGYDSALLVSQLRAGHTQGQHRLGISEWDGAGAARGNGCTVTRTWRGWSKSRLGGEDVVCFISW